ncbi:DUF6538 domain-containing protein [Neotabrizicola shimadae]|uniref:Tyrosine-type recombinase/integrase n=1 Tax=Neotabrizicola shimadae TaxID=2807096 RepID=A0A8G1EC56_9RHOB|nr:DUF6538 domain-containing protein [Neotabrizicola shimadae]QYZ68831.1 tyrosine-type recombinase/integrase [Neotabrizicola shimadae]
MILMFEDGAYRVMCKHVQKKGNVFYYRRRIPEDVRSLHRVPGRKDDAQLFFSLKTSDLAEACRRADAQTRRFDALWKAKRLGSSDAADVQVALATLEAAGLAPGDGLRQGDSFAASNFVDRLIGQHEPDEPPPTVAPQDKLTIDLLFGAPVPRLLSDAKQKHFELGKGPKGKVATDQFNRAWNILLEIAGDLPLDQLRREHGNEFVRRLINQGAGPETIKRYLSQVRPVIQTGILEFELSKPNPFDSLTIPNRDEGQRKPRSPFTLAQVASIQSACLRMDDERRWVIAMVSDSMTRLAEVVGLKRDDVQLDAQVPHIMIRPNDLRRLKNKQSERAVPLVGMALWAARRAMGGSGEYLFPQLAQRPSKGEFTSAAVSAALNKWLKDNKLATTGQTVHSFRHTMRDRLRNVETPADLCDRIGGWAGKGVGETYGQGHGLELMHRYMIKTVIPT